MTRIFVYGSLRVGFGNHRLLDNSAYVGQARTEPRFTMLHLGGFPGVVADGETSIIGEVYDVDDPTLRNLDRLEGHPDFYARQTIQVERGGDVEDVQVYLLPQVWLDDARNAVIASGDWKDRNGRNGREEAR